jgi:hypothetical protein
MGIAYRADRSLGCTTSVWDGDVSTEDVQQHLIRLAGDPEWPPGQLHLTDLTTIGDVSIPDPELLALLYEGTNLSEELKVAVVVRADFVDSADLRFASAAQEMSATTFTDLALACTYLGLSETEVRATIEDLREQLGRYRK